MVPNKLFVRLGLCVLAGLTATVKVEAQQSFGDVGKATANTSNLGAAAVAGTNLTTGTISPMLPLLTLPGVTGAVELGLRYTAGAGVKVNDVASEVGLGWALTGTGAISREVKGFPDDSGYGWFMYYERGVLYQQMDIQDYDRTIPNLATTAGGLVNYYKTTYTVPYNGSSYSYGSSEPSVWKYYASASQAMVFRDYNWQTNTYNSAYTGIDKLDTQPDVFTVALPSGGVQFVFDDSGNPIPLQAQNIKIEALNLGNRTGDNLLNEFRITTSDGTQYLFGSPKNDDSYKEWNLVSSATTGQSSIPSKANYSSYIAKWLLKKITFTDGEEVNYIYDGGSHYELTTNNYIRQDYVYTQKSDGYDGISPYVGYPVVRTYPEIPNTNRAQRWTRTYTVRSTVSSTSHQQLLSIVTSQGKVEFVYAASPRLDVGGGLAGSRALQGMCLRDKQNKIIKSLQFVQHYADAGAVDGMTDITTYDRYHLMLDKVVDQGTGCDFVQLYGFAYNATAFCRNSDNKDDWGYLNGSGIRSSVSVGSCSKPFGRSFSLSGRDRVPSLTYSQALILLSITSAAGGVTSFTYELHDYNPTYSLVAPANGVGGLRIKSISQYDGVSHDNDLVSSFLYKDVFSTFSSGILGDAGCFAKLKFIHGRASSDGSNTSRLTDEQIRSVLPLVCGSGDDIYYVLRSDASFYTYASDYITYRGVTVDNGSKGKSRYEFTSWADADRRDFVDSYSRLQKGPPNSACPSDPLRAGGRGSTIALPFSLDLMGLDIHYVNGNYVGDNVTANFPWRTSRAAERGLLLKLTQLTPDDKTVAVTTNTYDFTHSAVQLPVVTGLVAQPDMELLGFTQFSNYYELYYYQLLPTWTPQVATTQVVYDQGANGDATKTLTSTTEISYANFLPQKITKYSGPYSGSGVTKYVTEMRRAQDFAGGDNDQTTTPGLLRKAGMLAATVEQETYQLTPAGSKQPTGASFSEYQQVNGKILPCKAYAAKVGLSSFSAATVSQSNGTWSLTKDANYRLVSTVSGYTADSRAVNTQDLSGLNRATIWGYGHTLPIAVITNGTARTGSSGDGLLATAGHTSFEEDGANGIDGDGWSIPTAFSTTEAKTGNRSARVVISQSPYSPGKYLTISAGANRHGKLVFSCWVKVPTGKTGTAEVRPVITGQGNNSGWDAGYYVIGPNQDWQYVQTIIDLDNATWNAGVGAADNLQLMCYVWCPSGEELLIDEVRIHRADALMQTMTYAPLVGKTSVTDPSGVSTYYTYDTNNNPRLVLNQKRDIVQRMRQQFSNQTSRPTATFTMPEVAMQNCPVTLAADYTTCGGATFTWDFGDGGTAFRSTAVQHHTYSNPGTYTASLLVTDPEKGAARLTKTIVINEAYYTELDPNYDVSVNLCEQRNYQLTLNASVVAGECQNSVTYQWQQQAGNSAWANVANGTTSSITYTVGSGTVLFRCIVGLVGVGNNASSSNLKTVQVTGYYPSGGCGPYDQD